MDRISAYILALILLLAGICYAQDAAPAAVDPLTGKLFEQVQPKLGEALDLYDRHQDLPDKTWIFGPDKKSNLSEINRLLDEAVEVLGISDVSAHRQKIRELEAAIRQSHRHIAEARQKRIAAPDQAAIGIIDSINPFTKTRQDYDALITAEQRSIEVDEKAIVELKVQFTQKLREIGLDVDQETVDGLLASVTGDDFITMAVVFNNVKALTVQLQNLTEQSGEALDFAKRYHGMYVILVKVLDHTQKDFVTQVRKSHIPKLREYGRQAQANIDQAQKLIATRGGDADILEGNISANRITIEVADQYARYLEEQARMIETENREVEKNLATAINSYRTVKVSSDVAALIQTGRRNFEELMKLRVPYPRPFRNEVLRREFERMTRELQSTGG
jgi:hypothetical protein